MLDETEKHWQDKPHQQHRWLFWVIAALLAAIALVLIAAPAPAAKKDKNVTVITKVPFPMKKIYSRIQLTEDWPIAGREAPPVRSRSPG